MKQADTDRILDYLEGQKRSMVSLLQELVSLESPTNVPETQDPVLGLIGQRLEAVGFTVLRMPGKQTGGFLVSRPAERVKGAPLQLLVGHCDTVWPLGTIDEMPPVIRNGTMKGPGVFDMKSGLVQMIYALKAIRAFGLELRLKPVLIINSDEEKGSRESTAAIRRLSRIASRAFILEPPFGPAGFFSKWRAWMKPLPGRRFV